jgi:signal peptidase I
MEALVVAFIAALVVRGFEAQAFVIPTGSMAPTLMGRHKEIACPDCGFVYAVNASEEVEGRSVARTVAAGLCGNCRYQARLDETPSYKGDRILVMMFPYDLPQLPGSNRPSRWDVVVFRYPEEPEVSYIKRLVGLPGETVRIVHGDVFIKAQAGENFNLARKPLRHQTAMQINVFDDRHRPASLAGRPEWQRWRSEDAGWQLPTDAASQYRSKESAKHDWTELRYHNLVPDNEQWEAIVKDGELPRPPRATLVTDFYSYNTNMLTDFSNELTDTLQDQDGAWMQPHWVGDLTLDLQLEILHAGPGASVRLELIKAGIPHRCTIHLASGAAVVTRGDRELAHWQTPIKGSGRHQIEFANVDDRVSLIVDGRPIGGEGAEFESNAPVPIPAEADLSPAAIAARDADVIASDLVLKRDIYYTQNPGRLDYGLVWDDRLPRTPAELFDFLSDTSRFGRLANVRSSEYPIGPDRYFMLGDNSPRSKDSRGWGSDDALWDTTERRKWEVPRQLLTGKAFYVYWPHGVPVGPQFRFTQNVRFPFRPYVERMKWIR